MPQPTVTIGLTIKDNVFLILTKFTTIIIHTTQVQVNAFIHSIDCYSLDRTLEIHGAANTKQIQEEMAM